MGEVLTGSRGRSARRIVHGTYKGDGTYPKRLTLGFRPSFLAVYAVNSHDFGMTLVYPMQRAKVYSGGVSAEITWHDDGVEWQGVNSYSGDYALNAQNAEYAYLAIE